MKRTMRILVGSVLIALSPMGYAQTASDLDKQVTTLDTTAANKGQTLVATKIASNFTTLAGSDANALKLVNALRTGTDATLTTTTTTPGTGGAAPTTTTTESTITPATGKMGWGNVKIALALAQAQLTKLGITNPTADQLNAALNGGTVSVTTGTGATAVTTETTLDGVLAMRAEGMGWGQIAQAGGTKLGPVVSQLKMANVKVAALPPESGTPSTTTTTTATAKGKGVTTADGTTVASGKGSSKGITTATGAAASGSGSRGLVTADGATAGHTPKGNAYGRGIVSAAGGTTTNVAATGGGKPTGAGVMTGTGGAAAAVSTGAGNAGGNGKGNAGGNGGGKGKS